MISIFLSLGPRLISSSWQRSDQLWSLAEFGSASGRTKLSSKGIESKFGGLTGDPTGGNFGNHSEAINRAARGG